MQDDFTVKLQKLNQLKKGLRELQEEIQKLEAQHNPWQEFLNSPRGKKFAAENDLSKSGLWQVFDADSVDSYYRGSLEDVIRYAVPADEYKDIPSYWSFENIVVVDLTNKSKKSLSAEQCAGKV